MKDLPLMCTCVRELFTYIEMGGDCLRKNNLATRNPSLSKLSEFLLKWKI